MPRAMIALALALICAGQISPAAKPSKSVRVGDYLVTANLGWVSKSTFPRYHLVVVEVTVRNVSQRISHTHILFPKLKVKPDYEYEWDNYSSLHVKPPDLNELLPGEESTGGYVFDARNGTTPVALMFEPMWNPVARTVSIELAGLVDTQSTR